MFFIGYFFIIDKLETELPPCDGYRLSNIEYVIIISVIVIFSSFYQVTIGNWILERIKLILPSIIINCTVFALFVEAAVIALDLVNVKTIEMNFFTEASLAILILGLIFSALIQICRQIFKHRFTD